MGKNGLLINIVPGQQLVIIRMDDDPDDGLVPFTFRDALWDILNFSTNEDQIVMDGRVEITFRSVPKQR